MPDPLRILYIDTGPWNGGAQRSLSALVHGLMECGEVEAAAVCGPGLQWPGAPDACLRLPLRQWGRSLRGLSALVSDVPRLIRAVGLRTAAFEPDLIHANGTRSGLVLPRNICRAAPAIVHARDLREPVYVTRVAAARAAAVVAISDTVARQWQARVPGSPPVLRVYNGVDVGPRSTMPRSRSESSVIGLVADMVPWKRHRLFLQVLAELRRRGRPVRGLVVGRPLTGRGVRYLAELKGFSVQLGVADAVEFVTDAEEALPHIERMDVLLSTAEQEPFGRTVVEALALGRPVVAVRGAGPEEILAGCGAGRCAGPDAGPLARAVSELLGQAPEELAQMARKRAADFATERMVQEMADLYRRLHRAGGAPEGVLR